LQINLATPFSGKEGHEGYTPCNANFRAISTLEDVKIDLAEFENQTYYLQTHDRCPNESHQNL
jgi:hypothetical protein